MIGEWKSRSLRPMKFSIRDLLLVMVIVALALGWWVNRSQFVIQCERAEQQRDDAIVESRTWKFKATSLAETMRNAGWKVDIENDHAIALIGPPVVLPEPTAPPQIPPSRKQ